MVQCTAFVKAGIENIRIRGCESGCEVVIAMAKVIKFYVPDRFRRRTKWIPCERRGKVIQFPPLGKKSA
jgi:hypothetical protein